MQYLFEAWCRDPRPLLFAEYLDELYRSWDVCTPASHMGQELAELYRDCHCRIQSDQRFALCYVGIDHLQRDGRPKGVSLLSRILRDAIQRHCPRDGLVAYLGGGNFMLLSGVASIVPLCTEICDLFDTQVPRVENTVLALSIGVVTNEKRAIVHFGQATELVMEMRRYAETLPGSIFVVDRRDESVEPA